MFFGKQERVMRENNPTYNQILNESAKLFDQKGYVKTTTREIADAVGINRGHLHYYFPKKEDILACHFGFYVKKIKYFFNESKVQTDDYAIYYGLLFACQLRTLETENFIHDLLLLGRYDLDAYFHLITDSLCQMILEFAGHHGQKPNRKHLQDSCEIGLKIAIRMLYVKFTYHMERDFESIWLTSMKHGLYQLGFTETAIEQTLLALQRDYQELSMERFLEIVARRDYDVLAEEFRDL